LVDASHEKETQANGTIQKLKTEITNLTKLVEQGTGLSIGQEQSVKELLKMKEDLSKERDGQAKQIAVLNGEIKEYMDKVDTLEGKKRQLEDQILTLKDERDKKQEEIDKEHRRKEILEKELKVFPIFSLHLTETIILRNKKYY
jgi:chromosome segregation ATPase